MDTTLEKNIAPASKRMPKRPKGPNEVQNSLTWPWMGFEYPQQLNTSYQKLYDSCKVSKQPS